MATIRTHYSWNTLNIGVRLVEIMKYPNQRDMIPYLDYHYDMARWYRDHVQAAQLMDKTNNVNDE